VGPRVRAIGEFAGVTCAFSKKKIAYDWEGEAPAEPEARQWLGGSLALPPGQTRCITALPGSEGGVDGGRGESVVQR
jgi:hypothetical protein